MRELTPHPEEQRSLAELRSEFRTTNLVRLRNLYEGQHPLGWDMVGDPYYARDRYDAAAWAHEMLVRLDAPCSQDFGLGDVPTKLSIQLEELAERSLLHESVTWDSDVEGVVDHDAPPCGPVAGMSDDELCDYVTNAIELSDPEKSH